MKANLNRRRVGLFLIDSVLLLIGGIASLFIRFGWDFVSISNYTPAVLLSMLVMITSLLINGIYRIVWAYMTNREIGLILRSFLYSYIFIFILDIFTDWVLPRSIGIVMWLGSAILILSSRVWWSWYVRRPPRFSSEGTLRNPGQGIHRRIGIIGAGEAGVLLAQDIQNNRNTGQVTLFIDDSARKIGREIRGIRVEGPIQKTNELVQSYQIDELYLAIPAASSADIQQILSNIDLHQVKVKILPSLSELMNAQPSTGMLREISIEDLLGRDPVDIDLNGLRKLFRGKKVMITGAGGSIGSEIARQVAKMEIRELLLLGRGEYSIYKIDEELSPKALGDTLPEVSGLNQKLIKKRIIADITDKSRMEEVFRKEKPDFVFHTAAHKHVPLMEENPSEAFRVNSLGTKQLIDLAIQYKVERFILISTDKAVKPTSIMGVSKRLAEMYAKAKAAEKGSERLQISIVRFGNVLGSRGSIIPKFQQQIHSGGPVTVTHPEMRRFFMTIPEASSLVLQASAFGADTMAWPYSDKDRAAGNGSLYVLDMGNLVFIKDLAEKMIYLAGYIPGQDIPIVYTGCRQGEKLYEELFLDEEKMQKTPHPKIFFVQEEEPHSAAQVEKWMQKLFELAVKDDLVKLKELITVIIPDNRLAEGEEAYVKSIERVSKSELT